MQESGEIVFATAANDANLSEHFFLRNLRNLRAENLRKRDNARERLIRLVPDNLTHIGDELFVFFLRGRQSG